MIPMRIPRVGVTVTFDESQKKYKVKNVVEDVDRTAEGFRGNGEGWVCVTDKNNYEYILPFERFKAKE